MQMKLSTRQIQALEKLGEIERPWENAYVLQASLTTLKVLEKRKLVKSKAGVGSCWCPRIGIEWRLTDEGRQYLAQRRSDG